MQLRRITHSATTWLLASALATTSVAAEPLLTNTPSFRIPFTVGSGNGPAVEGFAVLFGAKNGGAMQQLQRVPVSARGFQFSAPADGTWEFAIRMTDPAGNPDESTGPLMPELQVIVDTTAPTLDLELIDAGDGNVRVKWSSKEEFVPGSLKLQYTEGADGRWKPLSVAPSAVGQTTIRSHRGTVVAVRIQLTDRANNTGTITREIMLAAASVGSQPADGQTHGPARNEVPTIVPSTNRAPVGPSPFPQVSAQAGLQPEQPRQIPAAYGEFLSAANPPRLQMSAPSGIPSYSTPQTPFQSQRVAVGASAVGMPPVQPWRLLGQRSVMSNPDIPIALSGQPISQLVSDSVFNIAYTVEDIGPSGVSSVELFVTEDNGQQWFRYANDTDLQSPMQVDVLGEGTFGFAIRVRNGVGFIDPPPQPGDRPEIVVTVDRTAPTVELLVPHVHVNGSASVRLGWRVLDSQSTAIRLEWATTASGRWVPVFDWQADCGGYEWLVSPNMPHSLHFRLLARDAAGNIGSAQTSQPVIIDLKRPTARMIGVQPVTQPTAY